VRNRLLAAGLQLISANQHGGYITPMEATGNDGVWISRLRKTGNSISFATTADNVQVGRASTVFCWPSPCIKLDCLNKCKAGLSGVFLVMLSS
jgi:hypothetical protein